MENYKDKFDKLYNLYGVNYSGITHDFNLNRDLNEKYLEAFSFFKEIENHEALEILEIGASVGHACKLFPNYAGVEYSQKAVDIGKSIYGKEINLIQSDARKLPFANKSKGFVFSINVLEHVPEPNLALDELIRITHPGGYVYLDPAYNCRKYTIKKLEVRHYSELGLFDKFEKLMIPFFNNLIFRAVVAMPTRIYLEILMVVSNKPVNLIYKKLNPNFELIEKYGHVSDDDAFSSFDKHSILIYYLSRKCNVIGYNSLFNRIISRTGPIIIKL